MSNTAQGRPNRGYGKPTSSQYPSGNRYGHKERNPSASSTRRDSIPPPRQDNVPPPTPEVSAKHQDICAGPPPWLDAYLQDFKKKLISEITDDIMKALDASYKNDADKRRFKSSYFALKKRLTTIEAQRNAGEFQQQYTEAQSTAVDVSNDENKFEESKSQEKHYRPRNGRNGNYNRRFNEPIPSSSNGTNVTTDGSSSSTSRFVNDYKKQIIEEPTFKRVEEQITKSTQIAEKITLPNFIDGSDTSKEDNIKSIDEKRDGANSSSNETIISVGISEKTTITETTQPLKEIFKFFVNDESNAQSSSTADQSIDEDIEVDKTLCKKVQSMLNKLTPENFDVLSKQVKDLEMDTPEKQQEVVNVFVDRAISETLYSVVYAQMCKKFATEHDCIATFREMLVTRCDMELTYHKEKKTIRKAKMELNECKNAEEIQNIKAVFDQRTSNEIMGVILFMGELYNQDLLTDIIIEKCLQCLLQNSSEIELEYLCHVLALVGKNLMLHEKNIAPYMNHLVELRETGEIGSKLTTLINSVVDLMANSWEPLVPDVSPETTEFEDATDE